MHTTTERNEALNLSAKESDSKGPRFVIDLTNAMRHCQKIIVGSIVKVELEEGAWSRPNIDKMKAEEK